MRARHRRHWLVGAVIVVAAVVAYVAIPRNPDLTRFDPDEMARRETAMWRHYYEKRYLPLLYQLYETARREQGYSPLDSMRVYLKNVAGVAPASPNTLRKSAILATTQSPLGQSRCISKCLSFISMSM